MPDRANAEGELRFTLSERIQLALVSWLVPAVLRLIGCTLRETTTYEEGAIQSLAEVYPGIFPFWHRCVLPATWIYRHQHPAVMTSRSRDGEFIARVIQRFEPAVEPQSGELVSAVEAALKAAH